VRTPSRSGVARGSLQCQAATVGGWGVGGWGKRQRQLNTASLTGTALVVEPSHSIVRWYIQRLARSYQQPRGVGGCGDCELSRAAVHAAEWDTRD
jgi:hypothetical protein